MADHVHSVPDQDLDADLHEHHAPGGLGKYLAVFVALCVLTGISYAVGNSQTLRENSPGVMWAMMMAVSCAKAMLESLRLEARRVQRRRGRNTDRSCARASCGTVMRFETCRGKRDQGWRGVGIGATSSARPLANVFTCDSSRLQMQR